MDKLILPSFKSGQALLGISHEVVPPVRPDEVVPRDEGRQDADA